MRDVSNWSLNLGLWGSVRVRLHASLLVVAVLAVYLAYLVGLRSYTAPALTPYGLLAAAILLASVVVHELGHALAAWRMGGAVDLIVLGPLGGLHPPHMPHEPHREVAVALSGPLANLLLMVALTPALVVQNVNLGGLLLQPLYPSALLSGPLPVVAMKLTFWINWLLLVVNLIPAAPLDGGRALRSVMWPVMGYRAAMLVVSRSGLLIALCLLLVGWFVYQPDETRLLPPWVPLAMLSIYLFFCARQEANKIDEDDEDDDLFGYDFSQGYTSLERAATSPRRRPNAFRRWLQKRRDLREQRLREIEDEEERRVDEILIRVKELGMHAISPEERALLHRVSVRYRNRLQH